MVPCPGVFIYDNRRLLHRARLLSTFRNGSSSTLVSVNGKSTRTTSPRRIMASFRTSAGRSPAFGSDRPLVGCGQGGSHDRTDRRTKAGTGGGGTRTRTRPADE